MSELTEFRRHKDQFFGGDDQSPLTPDQRRGFQSLSYYDENPGLGLELSVQEFGDKEVVEMQTSTGDIATYRRWGRIAFDVEGEIGELILYQDGHGHGADTEFFVPFVDSTSGDEANGSGRYVEAFPLPGGKVSIGFNYAYKPYCAYNERWSCPLTPFENRLQVPIHASEKSFK